MKEHMFDMPRFEAVAKIGATWEEVKTEYDLLDERIKSAEKAILYRWPNRFSFVSSQYGELFVNDVLPNQKTEEKQTTATLPEFYPNAKRTCLIRNSLAIGYLLVFDENDRIIVRTIVHDED